MVSKTACPTSHSFYGSSGIFMCLRTGLKTGGLASIRRSWADGPSSTTGFSGCMTSTPEAIFIRKFAAWQVVSQKVFPAGGKDGLLAWQTSVLRPIRTS